MSSSALEDRIKQWTKSYAFRVGMNTPEDSARFVELYNSIYSRRISDSYYYWRFFSNESRATLAFVSKENELIGVCGFNLFDYSGSYSIRNALLVDMMVSAAHQSVGLVFSRLNLEVENAARLGGAKCLYLFPNQRGAAAWLATKDSVRVTQLRTCICETRPAEINLNIEIQEVSRFDHWVDNILNAFSCNHPSLTFTKRDAQFLNWRFVANPLYKYSIHVVYLNGALFGYFVLKIFRDPITGNTLGDIVDILWSDDNSSVIIKMLEFALGYFYEQGIKQATIWLQTNTILDVIGHDIGFKDTEQIRDFCYKPLDQTYIGLKDPKSWFITLSDSEVY